MTITKIYNKHREVVHMSASVCVVLFAAVYFGIFDTSFATTPTDHTVTCDTENKPASPKATAGPLSIIGDRLKDGSTIADDTDLKSLLVVRKANLQALMANDPDAAFRFIVNRDEPRNAKKRSVNCVEQYTETEGDVRVFHTDFLNGTDANDYYLDTARGETITLHLRGEERSLVSGMHVTVRGHKLDHDMLVDGDDPASVREAKKPKGHSFNWKFWKPSGASAEVPDAMGTQQTLVILANFQNTPQPPISVATASSTVFVATSNYYKEDSYNKTNLAGKVVGWYTMPLNQSCDINSVQIAAMAAADPTVDFRDYSRIVIIAPLYCPGAAGYGSIGKWNTLTNDGVVNVSLAWILSQYANLRVIGHELGHGLGLHHASSISCGSGPITATAPIGCSINEYGDAYDIMGSNSGHMNAPHKDYLGWFDTPYTLEITQNGTYTLAPIEVITPTTTAPLSLKIKRAPDDYLYFEYRQPILADAKFGVTSDGMKGALLHTLISQIKTQLIDTTAGVVGAALQPGMTFVDPLTKSSVTVTAKNSQSLTAQVTIAKNEFISPSVAITSPVGTWEAPASVSGTTTVTATANDENGIQKVEFWRSGDATPFATATVAPYTADWNTRKAPNGQNLIYAVAYDNSGTPWGAPNNKGTSFYQATLVENTDSVSPTAKLTSPAADNLLFKSPMTLAATASDNTGVYRVGFYVNGVFYAYDTTAPYSFSATLATGTYSTYVVASDFVGNSTTSLSRTFSIDNTPPVVTLTNPLPETFVPQLATTTMSANVVDETSMVKGRAYFYVNNVQKCVDAVAPYTCNWIVPANNASGTTTYQIKVLGYDSAGNPRYTLPINVYGQ